MRELGRHDFGFQTGSWRVKHRKLRRRLDNCGEWESFDGTCEARELLDGAANIEEHRIDDPAGSYGAVALRSVDLSTGEWSIWWLDGRGSGQLDVPVKGGFENRVGTFYALDRLRGEPIDIRFIWSAIGPQTAHWEQAFAPAGSGRWETNWTMLFERVA
jgi:hypothetical protein